MEKAELSRKQYWVLLAISVAVSFALPLVGYMISYLELAKQTAIPFGGIAARAAIFSTGIGIAVLVYAAVRYRFRSSLVFAAGAILENLVLLFWSYTVNGASQISTHSAIYSIVATVLSCALPILYIGIAKAFSGNGRNEAAAILLTFFSVSIAGIVFNYVTDILMQLLILIPGGYATMRSLWVFPYTPGYFLTLLYDYLIMSAAYLVLKLIFSEKAWERFHTVFKSIKTTVKKLWDATAK